MTMTNPWDEISHDTDRYWPLVLRRSDEQHPLRQVEARGWHLQLQDILQV